MPEETLYTVTDAAKQLGVTYETLQRWIEQGLVEIITYPGGRYRISQNTLNNLNQSIPSLEKRKFRHSGFLLNQKRKSSKD